MLLFANFKFLFFFQPLISSDKVLARRVLTLVVYVSRYSHVAQRTYGILIVTVLILVVHMSIRPFKHFSDNALEALSLTILVYAAGTVGMFPSGGEIF